jgi:hypothetical protein
VSFHFVLAADNLGVAGVFVNDPPLDRVKVEQFVPGAEGAPPSRGASEIHTGSLKVDREVGEGFFVATIEPWHGNAVVVRRGFFKPQPSADDQDKSLMVFGPRVVLDATLDAGHALWVADIEGDGNDEVFAGHRGKDHRVSMYKFDPKANAWNRTVIDRDIAAQDLRGGDLDGDGSPDIVAVGGSTHNVVWYRPKKP